MTERPGEQTDTTFEAHPLTPDRWHDLEQLFGRPVDLVVESAIRNRYFREAVDKTKALLYAA